MSHARPDIADALPPRRQTVPPIWRHRTGYVYFIQEVGGGPVKIGFALTPTDRLRALQTGNPRKLRIVRTVRCEFRAYERHLHRYYAPFHLAREWFKPEVLRIRAPREVAA
jgi:hypothetical protein